MHKTRKIPMPTQHSVHRPSDPQYQSLVMIAFSHRIPYGQMTEAISVPKSPQTESKRSFRSRNSSESG